MENLEEQYSWDLRDLFQNKEEFYKEMTSVKDLLEKIGIYKDTEGKIHAVKPICTHLGCLLNWNEADKTWDCPCHGSRFTKKGKLIDNPSNKDLNL